MMKRFLINFILLSMLVASFSSCRKQLNDDYADPSKVSTATLGGLLSGMFLNKRIHPSYYDFYTFVMPVTAGFSQLTPMESSTQMYVVSDTYAGARWTDYYDGADGTDYNYDGPGIMSSYLEMQTMYNELSATEKAKQYIYLQCAKVLLYDQTAQMVDLWGDIPFFNAGSLNTSRSVSYAAFDDAATIYDTLISGLKDLNTYFDTVTVSSEIKTSLKKQDLLLAGSTSGWRRYANSLRLRLLMRTSYYNETKSKTEVTTMLNDPTTYPMITSNSQNVTLAESPSGLESDLLSGISASPYAPAYLLDSIMVKNGDPRTDVMWDSGDTTGHNAFYGLPYNATTNEYDSAYYYSIATYDSATFMYNYNVPGVIFTAAEVSFLSAEANERWGAGSTSASTLYAQGITQSTDFYYSINQNKILRSGSWTSLTTPTDSVINAYINNSGMAYTGTSANKLALIATQNWLNFFILQSGQAWAEYRRTKYPVLSFKTATFTGATTPPYRLLYPSVETEYNATNYAKVESKDTRYTKIFWDTKTSD